MKLVIDTTAQTLIRQDGSESSTMGLYTKEAFEALSLEWIRVGWALKHYFTFSWFGLPVIQIPEDLVRLQEMIYAVRPKVIVETGVFHGGSLLFHASLLEAMGGEGRVIGIELNIPPGVEAAIAQHHLHPRISLVHGDSTSPEVVAEVTRLTGSHSPVLVILDSDHTKRHVARELECYAPLVTKGSYIIAADGIMKDLHYVPGGSEEWTTDNPFEAAREFAVRHTEFRQQQPPWIACDSDLTENVTYWPGGWFKRLE